MARRGETAVAGVALALPFALIVAGIIGAMVASGKKAGAAAPNGTKAVSSKTRQGMRMTGDCGDFTTENPQSWSDYLGTLGPGPFDPDKAEELVILMMSGPFPECPWPPRPGTTFANGTKSWEDVVEAWRENLLRLQQLESAPGPGFTPVPVTLADAPDTTIFGQRVSRVRRPAGMRARVGWVGRRR